jgi:hypothetical protein
MRARKKRVEESGREIGAGEQRDSPFFRTLPGGATISAEMKDAGERQ